MRTLNEKDLFDILADEEREDHNNLIFVISQSTNYDLSKVSSFNRFSNCKFEGERIDFSNWSVTADSDLQPSFHFKNCELFNAIYFKDCFVQELNFSEISGTIKNLHLASMKIGFFHFQGEKKPEQQIFDEINLTINNCEIEYNIDFLNLKSKGNLLILESKIELLKIHNSTFERIDIDKNKFKNEFQFTSNVMRNSYFKNNVFQKSNFSLTDFGLDSEFSSNDFEGTALFEKLKNENRTRVKFKSCNFFKYTYFNNSKLYELNIETSKFQEIVSFQELELNSVIIDKTIFEKPAFFDDIQIHNFSKCNKRTLRNIKQQLLRADNKIDYDNFRAHELSSYKEELKIKLKRKKGYNRRKIRRDLSILKVNTFFSNNGTDWVRALKRTIFVAVFFYSILYIIYNSSRQFDLSGYNEYLTGLFRYFLLTDFHNPFVVDKVYFLSIWQWIPFVIGKIFIAIGIYEILVSFRKFRK
ncbi:hypothetical protein BC962_3249 [Gillisia mitskevichiae]|uniref:Pentapeptide repeat protein n=1 Tax=Gillisia mitskevichiae TaxID=270921 RepID=A0A495NVU1_9FLAO|nr:hypothetical protein [Gillisia mitskevichiae]RKS42524.1 hypothetical protein BC962_3249 [Gillisia mitskevichiae]